MSKENYQRNLEVFDELLNNYNPYDYSGLLLAMKCAIKDMEKCQSEDDLFVSVNRDKHCKRMRVVVNSLDRLIEDEYTMEHFDTSFNVNLTDNSFSVDITPLKDLPKGKGLNNLYKSQVSVDLGVVSKAIERYLPHWWS